MCQRLFVSDVVIETMGEIRALMPVLIKDRRYATLTADPDVCICSVDVERTAAANGYRVRRLDGGDYEVTGRLPEEPPRWM